MSALLEHRADSNIRSLPSTQPPTVGHTAQCLTPLELAVGDERMVGLLTDFCSTRDDVRISAFDIQLTGVLSVCLRGGHCGASGPLHFQL